MRLREFILNNLEPILGEWEHFARSIWPGAATDIETLRDHAADILQAVALDMASPQTLGEQKLKSEGQGVSSEHSDVVERASSIHAKARLRSGFDVLLLIAEYRALRATVLRLWRASLPKAEVEDVDDITRFNESIDQSLTDAVASYTKEVDRSRQMFLAILGHDLRGPLSSISLIADVISLQGRVDAATNDMIRQVSASASAMGRIISDLLDFTSTRLGGTMPLTNRSMDLAGLCEEVVMEIHAAHPDRPLDAETPERLEGIGDATRLRQVVSNLLGNAMQHGRAGTPVTLKLMTDGDDAVLSVHNEGTPIPPEKLATIFNPLVRDVRPETMSSRRMGSIGLGLYIAREIVASHGGKIEVESSAEAGTTFTARLPWKNTSRF